VLKLWDGDNDKRINHSYRSTPNQTTSWLVHSWSTVGAWAYTNSQDSPWPELGGGHHLLPYIIFYHLPWVNIQRTFFLWLLPLWMPITSFADFRLKWNPKQSCSPHQELCNYMWHASCTHINKGDSWFLVVENQIDTLTLGPSFGHNLCSKYSNG
jgi:hypothetical protein